MPGNLLTATQFVYQRRPFSFTDLLWSAWLLVPANIRLKAYQALWRSSLVRGGRTSSAFVRRLVPFNLYAKQGRFVRASEAFATQYVAQNTTIPVPRVLDVIALPGEGNFLLMTGVKGREYGPTGVTLDQMPENQRAVFTETLRDWFDQLRCLQPPDDRTISGFMGTGVLSYIIEHPRTVGPFASQDEFHAHRFSQPWESDDDALRAALEKRANRRYKICFTHGDITPQNILVDEKLRPCALVDWECAGWMPEYWELIRALYARQRYLGWTKVFTDIFPSYEAELTVQNAVWKHYFP
ncbi:kinase-like domain-containing protein [Crassisporium funariophilum]|nr:kinase-like domain-containing protein [Crassisporium funariophilum]